MHALTVAASVSLATHWRVQVNTEEFIKRVQLGNIFPAVVKEALDFEGENP